MTEADASRAVDRPERRGDVEWVGLDGEAVVYDKQAHTLHRLNAGAAAVWAACDGTASTRAIGEAIEDAYEGPAEAIARDVPAIIAQFRRLNLLQQPPAEAWSAR